LPGTSELLAEEHVLELDHAGVREQQRRGSLPGTRELDATTGMAALAKELEEPGLALSATSPSTTAVTTAAG
jgi:hypothetical protein